jgi:hypothetical protein
VKVSWGRAPAIWLLIAMTEILNGALRQTFLVPAMGDLPARQAGTLIGCLPILPIASLTVHRLRANSRGALVRVGIFWLALMLTFEVAAG